LGVSYDIIHWMLPLVEFGRRGGYDSSGCHGRIVDEDVPLEVNWGESPKMAVSIFRCSTSHRNVNDRHSRRKEKVRKQLVNSLSRMPLLASRGRVRRN